MIAYFALLLVIVVWGAFLARSNPTLALTRCFYVILCIILSLFMGFRSRYVGIDTDSYSDYFTRIALSDDPSYWMHIVSAAPIYSAYNKLLGFVSNNPQVLLVVTSFVICIGMLYFIRTFSDNEPLSAFLFVALYFYIDCFNGMRQGLAMALFLAAYSVAYQRKSKALPALLMVCAVGTHATTVLAAPLLILPYTQMRRSTYRFAIATASLLVALASAYAFDLANQFISAFNYDQYSDLFTSSKYKTTGKNILRTAFYGAIVLIGIALTLKAKEGPKTRRDRLILLPSLVGVCLGLAFSDNYLIGARIAGYYFLVFMVVAIPNCARYLLHARAIYLVLTTFASLVLFTFLLQGNYSGVIPYTPFWEA